jgi:hypothetical protein
VTIPFTTSDSWTILSPIEQSIKRKIEAVGTPLRDWEIRINYGIKTGCNDAFIIDGATRARLIAADPKSAEIIRPILRGRDIKRYGYEFANQYIIALLPSQNYDIDDYPSVKEYLLSAEWSDEVPRGYGKEKLEQTGAEHIINGIKFKARKPTNNKWFETQDQIGYWDDFSKQKIVWAETMRIHRDNISNFPRFSFCAEPMFTDKTCFMAIANKYPHYILGFLNSAIGRYSLKRSVSILDDGGYLLQKVFLETILIPVTGREIMNKLESLVIESLEKENPTTREEIDRMFYSALSFSGDEIRFIEEDNTKLLSRGKC